MIARRRLSAVCAAICVLTLRPPHLAAADDLWPRVRAMYGDLRSYADTGVVSNEYGTSSVDRHTFAMSFTRAPRRFLLDFRKQGGDRYVIWADPDAFHVWWKTTGDQYDYPNPNNASAISTSGRNSGDTALKIPTLLYAKAALGGTFANFVDIVSDGAEVVDGRSCQRIRGKASDSYAATGREVNVRTMTVWIDTESLLIRKVLEEWKPLPGQRSRVITTYDPHANPALDESRLRFAPPAK